MSYELTEFMRSREKIKDEDDLLVAHIDGYYKGYDHGRSDAQARILVLIEAIKGKASQLEWKDEEIRRLKEQLAKNHWGEWK